MATVSEPGTEEANAPQATIGEVRWVEFPATWKIYNALCERRGENRRPKYTYFDGSMIVVSPGHSHESCASRLIELLHEIFVGLSIDYHSAGGVTLKRAEKSRAGTEADATYYLSNFDAIQGKENLIMGVDPPPDLVVEVVISHPEKKALKAYSRFNVREVWICKKSGLEFLILGEDGRYVASPVSLCLPFLSSKELEPWVFRDQRGNDLRVLKQFRVWVSETLGPRRHLRDIQ